MIGQRGRGQMVSLATNRIEPKNQHHDQWLSVTCHPEVGEGRDPGTVSGGVVAGLGCRDDAVPASSSVSPTSPNGPSSEAVVKK